MNLDKHPFLCVLENLLAQATPHAAWKDGETLGVGIALPLGPEWLIARRNKQRIEVEVSQRAPAEARVRWVMEGATASALLQRSETIGETRVLGDVQFLDAALSSALVSDSGLAVRVAEMTRGK
jgi:hypothetical protein